MKTHEHLSTAKALIGLLVLGIVYVIYIKFHENQVYFFEDLNALRNYVVFAIVAGALLITLYYHASQTTHKPVSKTSKAKKRKK